MTSQAIFYSRIFKILEQSNKKMKKRKTFIETSITPPAIIGFPEQKLKPFKEIISETIRRGILYKYIF